MLAYGLGYVIIKLLLVGGLRLLFSLNPVFYFNQREGIEIIIASFSGLVNFGLGLFFLIFVFLVYFSFAERYKVWESIGKGFGLVKAKWKRLWKLWLLALGTAAVVTLVLLPVRGLFYGYGLTVLNLVVSLLFLAWMRVYLFKMVKE